MKGLAPFQRKEGVSCPTNPVGLRPARCRSRTPQTSTGFASRPSASSRSCGAANPGAQLADAQFELAKQYGFSSWRALKAHIDSLTVEGQLFDAARTGDVTSWPRCSTSTRTSCTCARSRTSGRSCTRRRTSGHLAAVDLLLKRGLDVKHAREGRQHLCDALGRGRRSPGHRAAAGRRGRRRRRAGGRPRARGDRLGHVLGRMRRRRASCRRGVPRQSRRAAPHLLRDRDEPCGRSSPDRGGRSVSPQPSHESQREQPAAAALRGANESAGDGGAAAGAGRRSAGGGWSAACPRQHTRPHRTWTGT